MLHRTIALIVLLSLLFLPTLALAQTPEPTTGSCAPATPCADPLNAGMRVGSLIVQPETAAQDETPAVANEGFGLAWAVMVLLVLALLYAIAAAVAATLGRALPVLPPGASVLIPILSVLGLGVALYLTYVETQNVAAVCGPVGDCNAVQASPYAKLFGFLPVGLLGAVGYVGVIASWFLGRTDTAIGRIAPVLLFGMALFGVLFTIYLTYLELFVIRAVCIWCLTSAVLMALVLALATGPALDALQAEQEELS